jgi:hypothetical protein
MAISASADMSSSWLVHRERMRWIP